jgi:hypothetical protein
VRVERFPYFVQNRLIDISEVARLTHGSPSRRSLVFIAARGSFGPRAVVPLKGFGQLKNPLTSSGIETATFRFVTLDVQPRLLFPLCYVNMFRLVRHEYVSVYFISAEII